MMMILTKQGPGLLIPDPAKEKDCKAYEKTYWQVIMMMMVMIVMEMMVMMVMMMVVVVNLPLMWIISLDMSDVVSRQLVNCSLNIQISLNHIFCIVCSSFSYTIQSNTIIYGVIFISDGVFINLWISGSVCIRHGAEQVCLWLSAEY